MSAPQFYDSSIDAYRDVTQSDVDGWLKINAAFGLWRASTFALMGVTLGVAQGKIPTAGTDAVLQALSAASREAHQTVSDC